MRRAATRLGPVSNPADLSTAGTGVPPALGVLLGLDGVVHVSDLPVQSFARHLGETLPVDRARTLIACMRGFLEGKPDLIPAGIELVDAEDGYQAVEIVARALGVAAPQSAAARRASRLDLAGSAWTIDPADGLDDLLAALAGQAWVAVLTEPGDPAAGAVLDAVGAGWLVVQVIDQPMPAAVAAMQHRIDARTDAGRVLVVGASWADELRVAHGQGCVTALVDRYGAGVGTPTWRAAGLGDLVGPVRQWLCRASTRRSSDARDVR